jgi:hypothetical protein
MIQHKTTPLIPISVKMTQAKTNKELPQALLIHLIIKET